VTTIAVQAQPDVASVALTVTGAPATLSLYRTDRYGRTELVRGSPFATQGGTLSVVDHEAPFGTLTYATSPAGADAVTTSLDVDRPWLTSPASPFLSLPVDVVDDTQHEYPPRSYLFDVIDRADPVYTWYRRSTRAGELSIGYETLQQRTRVLSLLSTGIPVLLRTPLGCPYEGGYYAVGDVRVEPLLPGSRKGVIVLPYVLVVAPPGQPSATPGWAWVNVVDRFASWADVPPAFATWGDVVAYMPPGSPRLAGPFGT
jgi:hypothetical protein